MDGGDLETPAQAGAEGASAERGTFFAERGPHLCVRSFLIREIERGKHMDAIYNSWLYKFVAGTLNDVAWLYILLP